MAPDDRKVAAAAIRAAVRGIRTANAPEVRIKGMEQFYAGIECAARIFDVLADTIEQDGPVYP